MGLHTILKYDIHIYDASLHLALSTTRFVLSTYCKFKIASIYVYKLKEK